MYEKVSKRSRIIGGRNKLILLEIMLEIDARNGTPGSQGVVKKMESLFGAQQLDLLLYTF